MPRGPILAHTAWVCNTEALTMTEFSGTDRFQLIRRLGAGGMGIVYEVFDRERGEHVALKTLSRVDPAGIYDLKKEFRSLADVRHPNVVSLYDIVNEAGAWFFTMELVYGTPFSDYVALAPAGADGSTTPARRATVSPGADEGLWYGLESYQRDRGLDVDGVALPDGPTVNAINIDLDQMPPTSLITGKFDAPLSSEAVASNQRTVRALRSFRGVARRLQQGRGTGGDAG